MREQPLLRYHRQMLRISKVLVANAYSNVQLKTPPQTEGPSERLTLHARQFAYAIGYISTFTETLSR